MARDALERLCRYGLRAIPPDTLDDPILDPPVLEADDVPIGCRTARQSQAREAVFQDRVPVLGGIPEVLQLKVGLQTSPGGVLPDQDTLEVLAPVSSLPGERFADFNADEVCDEEREDVGRQCHLVELPRFCAGSGPRSLLLRKRLEEPEPGGGQGVQLHEHGSLCVELLDKLVAESLLVDRTSPSE